jgi:hypothetical protein
MEEQEETTLEKSITNQSKKIDPPKAQPKPKAVTLQQLTTQMEKSAAKEEKKNRTKQAWNTRRDQARVTKRKTHSVE